MIPAVNDDLSPDFEVVSQPSYDFKLDMLNNRIDGFVDGAEALKQEIYIILTTERYKYEIHSWDFGIELSDLFGQPYEYVCPELERRIVDALMIHDKIESVVGFEFGQEGEVVWTSFTVKTVYGEIDYKLEVKNV